MIVRVYYIHWVSDLQHSTKLRSSSCEDCVCYNINRPYNAHMQPDANVETINTTTNIPKSL